jgi:hypothetical protein
MKKTTLRIKMKHGCYKIQGYLYTDSKGRKLFIHKSAHYKDSLWPDLGVEQSKDWWDVSEATTGYRITLHSTKTRKKATAEAERLISMFIERVSTPWKQFLKRFPTINTI